jgi:outer membrane protein assembly factor BamB
MRGEMMEPAWQGDDQLSNHYATSAYQRGMLFGFHGRVDFPPGAELRCVDARTGGLLWRFDPIQNGSVMLVNDLLFVLSGDGEFFVGPATSKLFKPSARAQILGKDTRAAAAFANGVYYARGKGKLVAVDLRTAAGR